jgi:hypothetical protein
MRASREELPILFGDENVGIRGADWGGMRAMIVSLPAGTDLGPLLQGLPNNLCSCPHWIYVIKGRSRVTYADGSVEIGQAGDLCYLPAGHTAVIEEDIEFVEISRPHEHQPVLEHVARVAAGEA